MKDVRGKVAVITGAADGIGRALAVRATEEGMRVVLADIDRAALDATVSALAASGANVLGVTVDVSDAASVDALARRATEHFGAVSLLVNNAGVGSAHAAWEAPLEEWSRVIGVNLLGVVHGLRSFLPSMIASGEPGHVVNVASAAGLVSAPGLAAYCATKSAVVSLSESLFQDLKARGAAVGASVVCPAWVKTRIATRMGAGEAGAGDSFTQGVRAAVAGAVRAGIPVSDAAATIFDAVRAGRFYVLTHEVTKAGVSIRAKDIVEGRPPTLFPFEVPAS